MNIDYNKRYNAKKIDNAVGIYYPYNNISGWQLLHMLENDFSVKSGLYRVEYEEINS